MRLVWGNCEGGGGGKHERARYAWYRVQLSLDTAETITMMIARRNEWRSDMQDELWMILGGDFDRKMCWKLVIDLAIGWEVWKFQVL